jgi:ubiquinone/menaquinone biosynthesis C-methylase UbiE
MSSYSHGSVVSVDNKKWHEAQEFESAVWVKSNRENSIFQVVMKFLRALKNDPRHFLELVWYWDFYAGDDWNFWWKRAFEDYKVLPPSFNKALEVGCGPYTNMRLLYKVRKIGEMHCLDPLMDLYLSFKHNWLAVQAKQGKVHTYKSQGEKLAFADSTFDLVICNNVLDHVENAEACLDEIYRVLCPGGYFIFGQDLSNEEDLEMQKEKERGFFVGHPIKLHHELLDQMLNLRYDAKLKKVLSREDGRDPRYHYGTYILIGIKK